MYIVIAIVMFGILITTHELGHFVAAKLCGVKVMEFSVGMGPAIFTRQKGETQYSLRLLPIGGYCAMDEDNESEDERAFVNQGYLKRLLILLAGVFMNFLTGFIILLFIVPGSNSFLKPVITGFFEGCPYESAEGLQQGDVLRKIDGHNIYFTTNISLYLDRGNGVYDIELERGGERLTLDDFELVPVEYVDNGEKVMKYGLFFGEKETGVWAGIKNSWYCALDFVRMAWMGLGDLVSGAVGIKDMSGPVGIVTLINDVGQSAASPTAAAFSISYLSAFIAVNLAVMNLLPLPALDGGRVLFLIVNAFSEFVLRKKLSPKYEGYVHALGMALLLGLRAVVMFNDIYKLFV